MSKSHRLPPDRRHFRALKVEQLESRQLLAVVTGIEMATGATSSANSSTVVAPLLTETSVVAPAAVVPVTPPGNFMGSALSNTQVSLTWTGVANATGYRLYEMKNGQPSLISTYGSSVTSATVSGLSTGGTYQFNLVAFNSTSTAATPWISVTTTGGVSVPGSFTATVLSTTQINLSWSPANNATGYRLYQESPGGQPKLIATYPSTTTSVTIGNLSPATTYQFNLVAFNPSTAAATVWISATTDGGVSVPQNFNVSPVSNTQLLLSWSAATNATGYRLYQMKNGTATLIATYTSSTLSAEIGNLTPNTTYSFNLVAFNQFSAAATVWISGTTAGGVLAPQNFAGSATSNSQVGLTWTASSNATGYRLYQLTGGQPVLVATYGPSVTSATVSGLFPGTTYQFNLVAFNNISAAASPWIDVTTGGGVSIPGNFTATPVSTTQIGLSWSPANNATGYRLYQQAPGGQPTLIATYPSTTTSVTIGSLSPATTYQFNLVAFNQFTAAATVWISATTAGAVSVPQNFTATPASNTQIALSWSAATNATGYRLYKMSNGQPVLVATYTAGTIGATVGNLNPNTTYSFNLVAFNQFDAAATIWISATTNGGVSPPGNFNGTPASNTQVALTWTAATNATGYRLYQMIGGQPSLIATYGPSVTSAVVSGLSPGNTYQFNLVAFNGISAAGTPWIDVTTSGGVSVPASFTGTPISNSQIGLSWSPANNATGYRLYELIGGTATLIATYPSTTTATTISNLQPNTTYQFNLVAFNQFTAAATNWISATTPT